MIKECQDNYAMGFREIYLHFESEPEVVSYSWKKDVSLPKPHKKLQNFL